MTEFTPEIRRRLEEAVDDMMDSGKAPSNVLQHAADVNAALQRIHDLTNGRNDL